jgi:hypothetical protein
MSKLSITFQFENEHEAQAFLVRVNPTVSTAGLPLEVAVEKSARAQKTPKAPKAEAPAPNAEIQLGIGRPAAPLSNFITPPLAPEPVPVPKVPAPTGSLTLEDVRTALRTVFNSKGAGTATELLKKFSATSVSNVKPEDYAAFIKACS